MGRATTVLLVLSGEEAEGSDAGRALRSRIAEREDLEPASMSRLAALAAEEDEDAGEEAELEAERQLDRAEEAFSNFDYAGATTALGEALELLRPLALRLTGRRRLGQIHFELAMILQVHGEERAAREEIRTSLHIDPECSPDPARHSPELIELFRSVSEGERPTSSVRVTTTPEGARLSLDGGEPQRSPATFEDVTLGRHYLAIERDGFLTEVHVISVGAGESAERAFALTEGPPPMRASAALRALQSSGPDAEEIWRREAATLTEADNLVIVELDDVLRLAAFDGRGGAVGEELTREGDDSGAAAGFLDEVLPPPSVPFYGQWWFWTPVALGVSLVLAGLTFFAVNVPDVQLIGGEVAFE